MRQTICCGLLAMLVAASTACRRENPATVRAATAAAVAAANEQATAVAATATAVVEGTVATGRPQGTVRRARVVAGNLGVAATGISAGIQLWSRPGGVMAGGATMTGTVTDGAEVDVLGEAEFLGQEYFRIRDSAKEGWIDGRFLRPE